MVMFHGTMSSWSHDDADVTTIDNYSSSVVYVLILHFIKEEAMGIIRRHEERRSVRSWSCFGERVHHFTQ